MIPVIIPYFKNKKQLDKCIKHLNAQKMSIEIFIRDNSIDNIYFTAAINEGIKYFLNNQTYKLPALKSIWKYILIINQDMYLRPNALSEMVKFMDSQPKCGIGMPVQLTDEDSNYTTFAGGAQAFPKGMSLIGNVQLYWTNAEITWASGGCMILRRKMIQEIGLLDENFRFVGSDSDYSFTARSRGWQVWRIAKAKGVHELGKARAPSANNSLNLIKVDDMLYFAKKWLTKDLYRELADEIEDTDTERVEKEIAHLLDMKRKIEGEKI